MEDIYQYIYNKTILIIIINNYKNGLIINKKGNNG